MSEDPHLIVTVLDDGTNVPTDEAAPPFDESDDDASIVDGAPIDGLDPEPTSLDPAILARLAGFDQSDTDNARRLLTWFGDDLRVRRMEGGKAPLWAIWSGTHWDDVSGGSAAIVVAQSLGDRIKAECGFIRPSPDDAAAMAAARELAGRDPNELSEQEKLVLSRAMDAKNRLAKRREARHRFAVSSKNAARVSAALAMAAPHRIFDADAFNADPLVVATPRETLRFERVDDIDNPDPDIPRWVGQCTVIPGHRREDMLTRVLPYAYTPGAPAPTWRAFIEEMQPDPALRRFVQVSAGLGLLGLTEQALIFHYGSGANGKSVFLEVVSRILGPLAVSLPAESISGDGGRGGAQASPDVARLYGARLCRVAEIPEGVPLQEEVVKRLTGGERFPVRNLFEGFFEFEPRFIAMMSGNGYPRIGQTDNGIWRRIKVVHWGVTLPEERRRNFHDVVAGFLNEAEGILDWLVEGARIYLSEGLVSPPSVTAATDEYRDEQDTVKRFFQDCVDKTDDPNDAVQANELFNAYREWAEANAIRAVGQTKFGRDAPKHALKESGRLRMYLGIRLRSDRPRSPSATGDAASRGYNDR